MSRVQQLATASVLVIGAWSLATPSFQLPPGYTLADPSMARRVVGGVPCFYGGGTGTVCCPGHTGYYSNISGSLLNPVSGNRIYSGLCDINFPRGGCRNPAVGGCNSGAYSDMPPAS